MDRRAEQKRTGTLQGGIMRLMLFLVILACGILGALSAVTGYHSTQEYISKLTKASADSYSSALDRHLRDMGTDITGLALSGAFSSPLLTFEQKQANLKNVMDSRSDLSTLYLVGADGIGIQDASEKDVGADYSNEEFFKNGIARDGLYIDEPTYDKWSKNVTMTITYHLPAGDALATSGGALLCMDIRYDVIRDIIRSHRLGDTGYGFLLDSDGNYLAHYDERRVLDAGNILDDNKDNSEMRAFIGKAISTDGYAGGRSLVFEGENVRMYTEAIESTGWTFVAVAKTEEFMGDFYMQMFVNVIALAACLLIAVLLALALSRRIAKPIAVMTERMRLFAEGDLHSPMPETKQKNEIGVLYDSMTEAARRISYYIADTSEKLGAMADGDITAKEYTGYVGDYEPIKESFVRIQQSMSASLDRVVRLSAKVQATAHEMAASAEELSANAASQAAAIGRIDQRFNEIKSDMDATAAGTADMVSKTMNAKAELATGSENMRKMLDSIRVIDEAVTSVKDIIKAIDGIAFQTNILSINAAVEAARAGVHGRGFSVVADEVRELAGKSAVSAKQTEELIMSTLDAVDKGRASAEQSGERLIAMDELVAEVGELVVRIEESACKQAQVAQDIYNGISTLNAIVQANSAMSEETANASVELSQFAHDLDEELSFFSLDGRGEKGGGTKKCDTTE
ncbi:MAG: methyl-accepting chemotaxis protein [Clostridiales Family XIII bacterium]|jgi:methyl-accepting chemotaxis protein|nr:methyl-accepting chemotaxis protein [Clostridiales Family XIII bacterium]